MEPTERQDGRVGARAPPHLAPAAPQDDRGMPGQGLYVSMQRGRALGVTLRLR